MAPGNNGRRGPGLHIPLYGRSRGAEARPRKKKQALLRSKTGRELRLRKPLAAGGIYREKRRLRYWRSLAPALAGAEKVPEQRLNGWLLVLAAKKIPHIHTPSGDRPRLYIPALYEAPALHEIAAFERERAVPIFVPPVRSGMPGVIFFLAILFFWHALRWGWLDLTPPSPPFPAEAKAWAAAYGLDAYRARTLHEWWRAVTALTLHADSSHLFSNIGFGLLFLGALCRRAGLGLCIALTVLSGILGNVCNALTREAHVLSIGFSTALFGAMGALCALAAADVFRHHARFTRTRGIALLLDLARRLVLPLAAGLALLGLLGGGGEAKTDYPAHIWGFCAGLGIGLVSLTGEAKLFSLPGKRQSLAQALIFAATLALLVGAWLWALPSTTLRP